jgi:hypothetical protein
MYHICVHDNFEYALKTKLNWSKNVQEERCPFADCFGKYEPRLLCAYQFGILVGKEFEIEAKRNGFAIWFFFF